MKNGYRPGAIMFHALLLLFTISTVKAQEYEATSKPIHVSFKNQNVVSSTAEIAHHYYALLIAVEEYQDPDITSLSEPVNDAQKLKDVLVSKYSFLEEDVTLLKNPTFEELNVVFEQLTHKIGPNDNLLILYAGHGYFDEKTGIGYWLPSDAEKRTAPNGFVTVPLWKTLAPLTRDTHCLLPMHVSVGEFSRPALLLTTPALISLT